MLEIARTTTDDPRFRALIAELDAELRRTYGDLQAEYAPNNVVESIATAVVALDGARPVGTGCFRSRGSGTVELKRMFVAPDVRGQGIAGRILDALEAWARELGVTTMVLETGVEQRAAITLYTRRGFVEIPCFGPYAEMPTSVCMSKPFTG